jgi:uncharacterized membrane protein
MNKKVCQNIVKWDLISKFLLSEIQWCNQDLILTFDLWFIYFWNLKQLACKGDIKTFCSWHTVFVSVVHIACSVHTNILFC